MKTDVNLNLIIIQKKSRLGIKSIPRNFYFMGLESAIP
jgi:hypothetical protein